MIILDDFHSNIQLLVRYLASPTASYQDFANELGITKEAVRKRLEKAQKYMKKYGEPIPQDENIKQIEILEKKNERLKGIIKILKIQIVLHKLAIFLSNCFKEKVLKYFPKFNLTRYNARQKLQILRYLKKYLDLGGTLKEFCKALGKSPETVRRWQKNYDLFGFGGLVNKTTRPKNFGNKVPLSIKQFLVGLFLRFPRWSEYQYHMYLRSNPMSQYYVSLRTIRKLKRIHVEKSALEKERIIKRWCFDQGTDVWTIDFTYIIKTDSYSLQLLTISDCRSRFLFETALFLETSTELVMQQLTELFLKHGRPTIIKADNGPEFRIDCEDQLRKLSIYLLNNPQYYGQFNSAHERIHRELKRYIDDFSTHKNLTNLVQQIKQFEDEYNYKIKKDYLEERTPADVYFNDKAFVSKNTEVVTPYEKDGELRMKFTNREGLPARMALPLLLK